MVVKTVVRMVVKTVVRVRRRLEKVNCLKDFEEQFKKETESFHKEQWKEKKRK